MSGKQNTVRAGKKNKKKTSIPSLDYDVSNYLTIMQNLEVTAMLPSRDTLGFVSTKRNSAKLNKRGNETKKSPARVYTESTRGWICITGDKLTCKIFCAFLLTSSSVTESSTFITFHSRPLPFSLETSRPLVSVDWDQL